MKNFYETLYNIHHKFISASQTTKLIKIKEYLTNNPIPTLKPEDAESLAAPFTQDELLSCIKQLKNGKAPGPDGYSNRFYKSFPTQIAPILLSSLIATSSELAFPSQTLEANITIIPKPGKDPTDPGSYRPISLLNCDLKMYSKLLANRLNVYLPSLIHTDQVGFLGGREASDNTIRQLSCFLMQNVTEFPHASSPLMQRRHLPGWLGLSLSHPLQRWSGWSHD